MSLLANIQSDLSPDITAEFVEYLSKLLNIPSEKLPPRLDKYQVATVLGVKPETTDVWASTGRYDLPYIKAGRHRQYLTSGVIRFLARNYKTHAGRVA